MSRFKWSRLYPVKWREQFADEFDSLNEARGVSLYDAMDIVFRATCARAINSAWMVAFGAAWIGVGYLNVYAHEVQWAAGGLLACALCASIYRPEKWFQNSLFFFLVIPVSSLLIYQDPSTKHAPLYQTAIALIPSTVGALIGRIIGSIELRSSRSRS